MRIVAAALAAALAATLGPFLPAAQAEPVRVGSKTSAEQLVLGEIYAAALEARGIQVERKLGLGGTLIAHNALTGGEIDLYPEYTGSALKSVLKAPVMTDPAAVYSKVKVYYEDEFAIAWLKPSAINNGSALVVRPDTAEKYGLKSLSDLAKISARLTIAAAPEFADRKDGLPGLKETYGIEFAEFRELGALALRYDALARGQVDVAKGFATDWQIAAGEFVALADDRNLFPPYTVAPVVRQDALEAHPRIGSVLDRTSALLDNAAMRELNRRIEAGKEKPRDVARGFLKSKGVIR